MKEIALVLSGGGIKGVAHIGLLAALQDHGVRVEAISGTSAGALIGAMYANGLSVDEMLNFFNSYSMFQPFNFALKKPGLFDSARYKSIIESVLPKTFEELKTPLYIAAADLEGGEVKYFSKGDLIKPVLASCAVPIIFSPVEIDGKEYTDGGVSDNFPIDPLIIHENLPIWGSYVLKPFAIDKEEINNSMKIIIRTNHMMMYEANKHKFKATQYNFMPNMAKVQSFNSKHTDKAFNIGYAYAKSEIEGMELSGHKAMSES